MSIHTEDFSEGKAFGDGFAPAPARKPRAKVKPQEIALEAAEPHVRSSTISPAPVSKHEEVQERALRPKLLQ